MAESIDFLTEDNISDNIAIIKIKESYRTNLTPLELYDITRGCWARIKIERARKADYALSVFNKKVIEVYKIFDWYKAEDEHRETIPYNAKLDAGRIIFKGELASKEIRAKYINKDVSKLFKQGNAHPVTIKTVEALDNSFSDVEREHHANNLSIENLNRIARSRSEIKPRKKDVTITQIYRDPYISTYAKKRAKGICQLCNQPAPFNSKDGTPYLESHHIIWLSEGGSDSIDNIVALCPNCHKKIHIVNDEKDIEVLKSVVK